MSQLSITLLKFVVDMLMLWHVLDLMLFYFVKIEDVQYVHRTCKYLVIAIVHPEWSHPNLCSHRISWDEHNVWGLILYVDYSRSLYSWKPTRLWQVLATGMRVNLRSAFIIWRVIWRELQQLVSHFLPGWRANTELCYETHRRGCEMQNQIYIFRAERGPETFLQDFVNGAFTSGVLIKGKEDTQLLVFMLLLLLCLFLDFLLFMSCFFILSTPSLFSYSFSFPLFHFSFSPLSLFLFHFLLTLLIYLLTNVRNCGMVGGFMYTWVRSTIVSLLLSAKRIVSEIRN